jgi:hypothetical protein
MNGDRKNLLGRMLSDMKAYRSVRESNHEPDQSGMKQTLAVFMHSWRMIVAILVILAAVAAPIAWFLVWVPYRDDRNAQDIKNNTIVSIAHTWDKTKRSSTKVGLLNVNTTQYIRHSKDADYSCFAFKGKNSDPDNVVKAVLAFGDTKSRDWLGQQSSVLSYAMKKGTVGTDLCFLLTDDEYSVLATEALSEIDYNNPDNTWAAAVKLSLVDTSSLTTTDERVSSIMKTVDSISGVDDKVNISAASIKNGSFVQWARVMSDANTVEALPAVYVNGVNKTSSDDFSLYDSATFYTYLDNLK